MNREILFRGRRIDNGEWIQGSLVTRAFVKSATGQDIPYIFNTDECSNADCFEDFTDNYGYYEVDPATVGQFTGLLDKKGNRVFEGDLIITETGGIGYVVWRDAAFAIKSPGSEAIDWVHSSEYAKCEVIVNINDNTELIKQS